VLPREYEPVLGTAARELVGTVSYLVSSISPLVQTGVFWSQLKQHKQAIPKLWRRRKEIMQNFLGFFFF